MIEKEGTTDEFNLKNNMHWLSGHQHGHKFDHNETHESFPSSIYRVLGAEFDDFGNFSGFVFENKITEEHHGSTSDFYMTWLDETVTRSSSTNLVGFISYKDCERSPNVKALRLIYESSDPKVCAENLIPLETHSESTGGLINCSEAEGS